MLLQLVGRLDAGETYARVNLENADLVPHSAPPSNDLVELELVNIIICQNAAHNHFEAFPPTADYPTAATEYRDKITIKVPRPQPLVHRRRTRYFTFPEDAPPTVNKRSKRTLPRGIASLGDYQVEYRARFNSPLHTFDVTPLNILSPAGLVRKLQEQARPRIERHFQRLLADLPSYELDTTGSTRRSSYKIKITLPPQTRQFCSHKEIFTILGFENQISEENTGVEVASTKWALVNNSTTENKVFLSEHFVDTATLITVLLLSKKISFQAETIYFYFGRYPTMFPAAYLNFSDEALCSKNPAATAYFFQLLLESIIDQLNLPAHSLRVNLTGTELLFSKDPRLDKTEDHSNNFNFYARFGAKITNKLGLTSPGVIWRLNAGRKLETVQLEEDMPEESEQEARLCQNVMSTFMREQFYNQEGGNATVVARWQQQWQNILTTRQNEAAAERQRAADAAAAAERQRTANPPPPPTVETTQTEERPAVETVEPEMREEEETPTVDPESREEEEETPSENPAGGQSEDPPAAGAEDEPSEDPPAAGAEDEPSEDPSAAGAEGGQSEDPPTVGAEGGQSEDTSPASGAEGGASTSEDPDLPVIEDDNNEEEEEEEEEEDPWMEIEIDNPEPRPPANFLVANVMRPHICTPPHEFPAYCTVIVKEGEPTDYVATRGLCSILGLIRDKQPNVVSNKCIVKNIKNMKYLSIEFVDQALNTFKIQPNNNPMWIKIDLRASRNVYY